MPTFLRLSRPALVSLAAALETGRLSVPCSVASVESYVPEALCQGIVTEINRLYAMGATPKHIAYTLHLIAAERSASQEVRDRIELVWTGPEVVGSESRDTSIVVRDLFSIARHSVLISSFAIDRGEKAQQLFNELATRMDTNSQLQVRMFLNVPRPFKSEVAESILLREFADTFRNKIWPGKRLPKVFYDPRALAVGTEAKACLHAKCIVVDDECVFVTSANFTEAAHERNIEAGVLLSDPVAAKAMRSQFENLVIHKILRRVPGIG